MLPPIYSTLRNSATIISLVNTRIFRHGYAPQESTVPYITWSLIYSPPYNTLSEIPQADLNGVQIDCWSDTDAGVEALAVAVRDAMEPHSHMTNVYADGREPDTKLYRIGMQFDFIQTR